VKSRAERFQRRSRVDSPFLDRLDVKAKEVFFFGVLTTELISLGCIIAVPTPDLGDDLWVRPPGLPDVVRCQLKTAWSHQGSGQRSYLFNIAEQNIRSGGDGPKVYMFGMRHPEGPVGGFHVACLDSGFLDEFISQNKVRRIRRTKGKSSPSDDRIRFNIIEVPPKGRQRKTRWILVPAKKTRKDISENISTFRQLFGRGLSNAIMDRVSEA
jgi:hypothetical protein